MADNDNPSTRANEPPRSAAEAAAQMEYDTSDPPPDNVIIELRDIYKSFGELEALNGTSLSIEKGISSVVMGGSGAGKSVLLKHIVKLLTPDEGEVWVKGQRMDKLTGDELDDLRLSIGYLFQGGALFDSMTVYENMSFFLERHTNMNRSEREDRVQETLEWVDLAETAPKYPAELSGGQQKRIALARSIILEPEILLYDEPTTGLDPISVRMVADLIVRLRDERGITSVAITHDLLCAEIIADKAAFIYEGEILESGTLDDLRQSDDEHLRNFFGS